MAGDYLVPMKRWTDVSDNPNSGQARALRTATLRAARRWPVPNRLRYLMQLVAGKNVLDVGVVEHFSSARQRAFWLHGHLAKAAASCLGVDVLAEGIETLRQEGWNVLAADITKIDLGQRFDLIVAGELIEHLGDPQGLFRTAFTHLQSGGRLVITTPNPYFLGNVLRHIRGRGKDSVDHATLLFPAGVAEMAEREGLTLDCFRGALFGEERWGRRAAFRLAGPMRLLGLVPEAFCPIIIYECVKG